MILSPVVHIGDIVQRIRPAVERLLANTPADSSSLLDAAIRANVIRSAEQLQRGSPLLETMVREGAVTIVPALYHLYGGQVEVLTESLNS